jgi:transposase-like protein
MDRGGDVEEIARRHGVRAKTLVWWRSELARRARDSPTSGARLLPVVVESTPGSIGRGVADAVEIAVQRGATRVSIRGAMSAEHLAAAIAAAMRSC